MEIETLYPIVIPRLVAEDASADERREHILLLEAARNRLDQEFTATLGTADTNDDFALFGFPSTVAFLKNELGMSGGRAKQHTTLARLAHQFESTFAAWRHNQVSADEARLLFQTAERMPDKYPSAENQLLELVGGGYDDTRRLLEYWRHGVDPPGVVVDAETQQLRRRFDYTRKPNGMIEGDFAFPQLAGETFIAGLEACMAPPSESDTRTATQRRVDACEDLARGFLEGSTTGDVGGERPHLNVHTDTDALEGVGGGLHETETGTVLTVENVRQLACDSSISRVVWSGQSEVIDVGRKTRTIPAATRRAVIARDRRCVWNGCGRSPRWADVHHIIHWADGGETVLSNLCLLCRYHHTLVHQDQTNQLLLLEYIKQLHPPEPARPT